MDFKREKNFFLSNQVSVKKLISLLLCCLLFAPSIVKLEHHHDHFECKAKDEKHFHNLHHKCEACDFEFSFFASEPEILNLESDSFIIIEKAGYSSIIFSQQNKYNFLLRAPPLDLI